MAWFTANQQPVPSSLTDPLKPPRRRPHFFLVSIENEHPFDAGSPVTPTNLASNANRKTHVRILRTRSARSSSGRRPSCLYRLRHPARPRGTAGAGESTYSLHPMNRWCCVQVDVGLGPVSVAVVASYRATRRR